MIIEQFIKFVNVFINIVKNEKIMIPFKDALKNLENERKLHSVKQRIENLLSKNIKLLKKTREIYQGWKDPLDSFGSDTSSSNEYIKISRRTPIKNIKKTKKYTSDSDSNSDSSYDSIDDISFDVDDTFYVDDVVEVSPTKNKHKSSHHYYSSNSGKEENSQCNNKNTKNPKKNIKSKHSSHK